MKLLHVIDNMGAGGPARSLLAFVKRAQAIDPAIAHNILSLRRDGYPPAIFFARRLGIAVVRSPQQAQMQRLVESSDVVLLHFWNTPHFWEFFAAGIAARYVAWAKVLGASHPQFLDAKVLGETAALVLTAPPTPWLRQELGRDDVAVVPGIADFGRIDHVRPEAHTGFNVDYIGTLNTGKIHPNFAGIMSRVDIPGIRVRVCGGQPDTVLAASIKICRDPDRFQCPGFVEDIATILKTSDVFGYPLSKSTYATSDKSLQEAMYAGIPPVIFPHGGPARFVEDGKTGLVATSEEGFVSAVEYLYRNPEKRIELGANARTYARVAFAPEKQATTLLKVLAGAAHTAPMPMLQRWPGAGAGQPDHAAMFLCSQGWRPGEAISAMAEWRAGNGGGLDRWIASLPTEAFQVEGGIVHWRNHAPADPALRWWSALWLAKLGRYREAAEELEGAIGNGAPMERWRQLRDALGLPTAGGPDSPGSAAALLAALGIQPLAD